MQDSHLLLSDGVENIDADFGLLFVIQGFVAFICAIVPEYRYTQTKMKAFWFSIHFGNLF